MTWGVTQLLSLVAVTLVEVLDRQIALGKKKRQDGSSDGSSVARDGEAADRAHDKLEQFTVGDSELAGSARCSGVAWIGGSDAGDDVSAS